MLTEGIDRDLLLPAACYAAHEEAIKILLARGAHANSGMRAAVDGPKPAALALLLQHGADPDFGVASGNAVILSPSHITYAEIVLALVSAGANVNVMDELGRTPLHLACSPLAIESPDTVCLLVARGASVSARDKSESLPIHHAAETGAVAIVAALLKLGAQPNATDAVGRTPLERMRIRREDWDGQQPDVGPDADWDGVRRLLGE